MDRVDVQIAATRNRLESLKRETEEYQRILDILLEIKGYQNESPLLGTEQNKWVWQVPPLTWDRYCPNCHKPLTLGEIHVCI